MRCSPADDANCDVGEKVRVPEMVIHRRSVTGACAWPNSDAVRMTFSFIIGVRLARRGKRRVSKEGGGKQLVFEDREVSSVFNRL